MRDHPKLKMKSRMVTLYLYLVHPFVRSTISQTETRILNKRKKGSIVEIEISEFINL